MSKRTAEGPHRTKEEGLEMSSIGGEAPQRATAAQLANRAIKSARGRRPRPAATGSSHSTLGAKPFGNIDPNIVPSATSQPQQPLLSNGFSFGQSQSFPPMNGSSAQPAQNGTSLSFGGASNPPSFDFASTFSSGQAPNNPFSNINTSQTTAGGGFQGFQGNLFNLSAENQNNQSANNNTSTASFNNMGSTAAPNSLFGANQANPTSSGFSGQSAAPSGGIFGQNNTKSSMFGQQQPFGAPSTPASSSQTPGLFGGGGSSDAMQTTPDGKSRADAPKTALFGMPAESNLQFGSNIPSTSGGASVFNNAPSQGKPFTSFGSGPTSEVFQPKPTAPATSDGPSLFGRVSKPAEQATPATDSGAQNVPTPAVTKDATPPQTTGSLQPTTESGAAKTTGTSMFSSAFKPSDPASAPATGASLFANPKPLATSSNMFSSGTPSAAPGTSAQGMGASLFAKPASATSGAEAPAATSSTSLFGTSNAPSATATSTTTATTGSTTLFGAPSASASSPFKPSALFSASPAPSQSSAGPSTNMFSATASDINKKAGEGPAPASSIPEAQPLGGQTASTPSLFSATPAFGGATGGNLFAPKATTQTTSAPDASTENKAQAPTASLSTAAQSATATPSLFGQTPQAATTTAPASVASNTTLFGETSKTPATTATSSAPNLFDNSKSAPSAASAFGKPNLFSDSSKPAPAAASSSVKPSLFSTSSPSDASNLFAKPTPSNNAANASQGANNNVGSQSQFAPPAPVTQQPSSGPVPASEQGGFQVKGKGAGEYQVQPYGPPYIPENLTKSQKVEFEKKFRIRALNDSFKRKISEMNPEAGDFVSLIIYYCRVRDAIGCPTGLVRKAGMKRTNAESSDNETSDSEKRAKPKTQSTESQKGKQATYGSSISQPSADVEMGGGSGVRAESARNTATVEPSSSERSSSSLFPSSGPVGRGSLAKRKAEDEGEGRPSLISNGVGKRVRNEQESESSTTSLFANSFASSTGARNLFAGGPKPDGTATNGSPSGSPALGGEISSQQQEDEQTGEDNGGAADDVKNGSGEGRQDSGNEAAAPSSGRSLFDRIQYDDKGQAKRHIPAEEERPNQGGNNAVSELFNGSKFASSLNPPGTPSTQPVKTNFDFGSVTPSAFPTSGRNSPSINSKPADEQPTDSTKLTGGLFGSPAPPNFGSNSIQAGQSGSAGDNTWKNDSPIRFSVSKPEEPASTSNATGTAGSPTQFPALFGGPRPNLGGSQLASSSQPAGFGFGGGSPVNSPAPGFGLSAATSADPSRSTTPGLTSDTTGAEESGDGEVTEKMPQVDLTRSGAGEENEDTLFEARASALRLDKDNGSGWQKRGIGLLRVLKHRTEARSRVLLRADPSGKVVLNVALRDQHPYTACKNSVQLLVPETEGKLAQWAVRVKEVDDAKKLAAIMMENRT